MQLIAGLLQNIVGANIVKMWVSIWNYSKSSREYPPTTPTTFHMPDLPTWRCRFRNRLQHEPNSFRNAHTSNNLVTDNQAPSLASSTTSAVEGPSGSQNSGSQIYDDVLDFFPHPVPSQPQPTLLRTNTILTTNTDHGLLYNNTPTPVDGTSPSNVINSVEFVKDSGSRNQRLVRLSDSGELKIHQASLTDGPPVDDQSNSLNNAAPLLQNSDGIAGPLDTEAVELGFVELPLLFLFNGPILLIVRVFLVLWYYRRVIWWISANYYYRINFY